MYSLGCVLYEMLAGQPPHTGPSAQNILIRILTERPQPLSEIRHTVPPHISAVVARSIEKLPADRFESASDFAQALDDASFTHAPAGPRTTVTGVAAPPPPGPAPSSSARWPRWITAAVGVLALGAGYGLTRLTTPAPTPAPSVAFTLATDSTHRFATLCCGRAVAISPQGDRIVYLATDEDGTDRLYQRPVGQRRATAIPGTEGGRHPFFSPNGEWLGFFDQGTGLKKVRFDGAAPLPLAPVAAPGIGAAWSDNGDVYFSDRESLGVWRVSADGGDPSLVAAPDTTIEFAIGWPAVLPDGDHALVTSLREGDEGPVVEILDLATGVRSPLLANAADARYVEPGYVVFSDGAGSIMAQGFDARALELTGERFRIADRAIARADGHAEFDISSNGTLVMLASILQTQPSDLVILDREGNSESLDVGREATLPRFSPDGRRLAFTVSLDDGASDIWTWDLERGAPTRVTFEGDNAFPSWSPDGESILFTRFIDGESHGYMVRRDGTGTPTRIIEEEGRTPSMSKDGRWLVWGTDPSNAEGSRIWVKETGSGEERMLFDGPFPEFQPAISPDGRWIAYVAEDDGDDQVYVQPFPDLGPRVKISTEGGREPRWNADGSELFFRDYASRRVIAVEVRPSDEVFEPGTFRELFSHEDFARVASATVWDVHPDGERFVFVRGPSDGGTGSAGSTERLVITNAVRRGR